MSRFPGGRVASEKLLYGRVSGSVAGAVDAGIDLLPDFEMAAIPVLEGIDRPLEYPATKRRIRAEGIRTVSHRGVLLLTPADLERMAAVGLLSGGDELYLCPEWNDEFEAFPGRITTDVIDFSESSPLGLEEWMVDSECLLALGDGAGLNFATLDPGIVERLKSRFPSRTTRR